MTPTELVEAFYAAGTSGDVEKLAGFFAENAVWDNRLDDVPMGGVYEGREAIREGLLGPLFQFLPGGIHTEVERILEADAAGRNAANAMLSGLSTGFSKRLSCISLNQARYSATGPSLSHKTGSPR